MWNSSHVPDFLVSISVFGRGLSLYVGQFFISAFSGGLLRRSFARPKYPIPDLQLAQSQAKNRGKRYDLQASKVPFIPSRDRTLSPFFRPPPAASRKRRSNRRHFERTFMLVSRENFRNPSIDLNSQFFRRYQLFVTVLFWISGPRKSGARLRHLRLRFEECPCGSLLQMQSASKGGSAAPGEKNISLRTLLFRLGLRTHLNSNFSFRITNSRSCRAVERSQTCLPSFKS